MVSFPSKPRIATGEPLTDSRISALEVPKMD